MYIYMYVYICTYTCMYITFSANNFRLNCITNYIHKSRTTYMIHKLGLAICKNPQCGLYTTHSPPTL